MHGEVRDVREVDALGKCDIWQNVRIARASQKLMGDMVHQRENIEFYLTQQEKWNAIYIKVLCLDFMQGTIIGNN